VGGNAVISRPEVVFLSWEVILLTRVPTDEHKGERMKYDKRKSVLSVIAVAVCLLIPQIAVSEMVTEEPERAMVLIGGCSGVCVSEDGLVLTARHCDLGKVTEINFVNAGRKVQAIRRFVGDSKVDGVVVYDCEGENYPWLPVAGLTPNRGDVIWSYGFPKTSLGRTFNQQKGQFVGLKRMAWKFCDKCQENHLVESDDPEATPFLDVTFPVAKGHSGGPLLTVDNEVLGVASNPGLQVLSGHIFLNEKRQNSVNGHTMFGIVNVFSLNWRCTERTLRACQRPLKDDRATA